MGTISTYKPINKHGILDNHKKHRYLDIECLEIEDNYKLSLSKDIKLVNIFKVEGYFVDIKLINILTKEMKTDIIQFVKDSSNLDLLLDGVKLSFINNNSIFITDYVECSNISIYCKNIK